MIQGEVIIIFFPKVPLFQMIKFPFSIMHLFKILIRNLIFSHKMLEDKITINDNKLLVTIFNQTYYCELSITK